MNFLCTRQGLQLLPEDTVETPITIAECLMPQIRKMAEMNSILTSMLFLHTVFTMNTSCEIFGKDTVGGWSVTSLFTEHLMGDGVGGLAGRGGWRATPTPTPRKNLDNVLSTGCCRTQERTEVIAPTANEKLVPELRSLSSRA